MTEAAPPARRASRAQAAKVWVAGASLAATISIAGIMAPAASSSPGRSQAAAEEIRPLPAPARTIVVVRRHIVGGAAPPRVSKPAPRRVVVRRVVRRPRVAHTTSKAS